jgi:hypothetical protein
VKVVVVSVIGSISSLKVALRGCPVQTLTAAFWGVVAETTGVFSLPPHAMTRKKGTKSLR